MPPGKAGMNSATQLTMRSKQDILVRRKGSGLTLGIDMRKVPEPTDMFIADYADVIDRPQNVSLIFGKRHPLTNRLLMLVEVAFPAGVFTGGVWETIHGEFMSGLEAHCDREYPDWTPPPGVTADEAEHAEFVPVSASMLRMSYAGDEAALDFHLFSTHDLAVIIRTEKGTLDVTPVLRVLLSTPLLRSTLKKAEDVVRRRQAKP